MQNRVPTKPNRALIRPEDGGSAFYATITRADEPTQTGDPLNKATFLKDETAALFGLDPTATPNDVFAWLGEWGQANWKLLAEYNTAGAYTFTVPDGVDELGVFILGGGNSGGVATVYSDDHVEVRGGYSGGLKQLVLKKSNGKFTAGSNFAVVVGAGAKGTTLTGTGKQSNSIAGGTSSFGGVDSGTGQPSDLPYHNLSYAPYGLSEYMSGVVDYTMIFSPVRGVSYGYNGRNIFDQNDNHVYCGAGGSVLFMSTAKRYQPAVVRAKGHAGHGTSGASGDATAPGDGGGAVVVEGSTAVGGNGADGLVLVYGRKVV